MNVVHGILIVLVKLVAMKNMSIPIIDKLFQWEKSNPSDRFSGLISILAGDGLDENYSCSIVATRYITAVLQRRLHPKVLSSIVNSFESLTLCEFSLNYFDVYQEGVAGFNATKFDHFFCEILEEMKCDGSSLCLTDECNCASNGNVTDRVFYCTDGSGCVAFSNLCDGYSQCKDSSDECLCEGIFPIHCPSLSSSPFCTKDCYLMERFVKDDFTGECHVPGFNGGEIHCDPNQNVPKSNEILLSTFFECVMDAFDSYLSPSKLISDYAVPNYCHQNCSDTGDNPDWIRFCDYMLRGDQSGSSIYNMHAFVINCDKTPYSGKTIELSMLCNGIVDCENHIDEKGCPGRFYCSQETAEWVAQDKICDNVKDCTNGYDECQECGEGLFSSSKFLIQSKIVFMLTIVGGISIFLTNAVVGLQCYKNQSHNLAGAHDRLVRLQVFVYDGLMGIYMILIFLASVILKFKGDFCLIQEIWRSSFACSFLGVVFSVSSHGSLISIVFMSVIRCLVCHNLGDFISSTFIKVFSLSLLIINLSNAVVPLLPILEIQNIFRTEIFLANVLDNPFIESNPLNMSRVQDLHFKAFGREDTIYRELENLNTISSDSHLFDYLEIGYYGNTAQCVHNLFSSKESYQIVKLNYCFVIGLLLIILCICYILIVRNDLKGKAELAKVGGARNANSSSALTVKVTLMIISQFISWVSLIVALVYYKYIKQEAAPMAVFEWLALVVIPVNSLLNPIFYSDLYKRFAGLVMELWKTVGNGIKEKESRVEIEMSSANASSRAN